MPIQTDRDSDRDRAADEAGALNRRELLGAAAVGGALVIAGAAGCAPREDAGSGGGSAGESGRAAAPAPFELEEVTIAELQEGMASGRWSAEKVTELYLGRIEQIDGELRSVIETNPDALDIARELDQERSGGNLRGPLHGVPILLKDNIATADRTTTTAGSLALEGSIPAADSFVARRLREAGAVLLGKANLSEWANSRGDNSSSGWSGRGGQCANPFALDRNPCGSSSGSGAATSGNLVAAAIGTETNGSVVCPSSTCGVVGIKPTVGLVSRSRIIPISHTQDTAGPMARGVADAAAVLGALTGVDPEDAATAASDGHAHVDYTRFLDAAGLAGARIGVGRDFFGFHRGVDALMEAAVEEMARQGAEIVDPADVAAHRDIGRHSFQVLLYELKAGMNAYLAALGPEAPVKTLAEIIEFNDQHAEAELPFFGQELLIQAEEKGPLTEKEYTEALETAGRLARADGIDKTMDEHRLDAIVAPTGGPAWLTDHVNGDNFGGGSSTAAAVAGYPNVTVPAGFVSGLPVGISFFGRAWSEPTLLKIAYAFEQTTKHRRAPQFPATLPLPTLDLG